MPFTEDELRAISVDLDAAPVEAAPLPPARELDLPPYCRHYECVAETAAELCLMHDLTRRGDLLVAALRVATPGGPEVRCRRERKPRTGRCGSGCLAAPFPGEPHPADAAP